MSVSAEASVKISLHAAGLHFVSLYLRAVQYRLSCIYRNRAEEEHHITPRAKPSSNANRQAWDAILARTGEETLQSIATASKGDPKQIVEELSRRHLIRPVVTQGHIGDVLPDKIIYDAQTTSGGSGGPLFNSEGKVIGINFAMVRDFGGSNFAIPVGYGKLLLKP